MTDDWSIAGEILYRRRRTKGLTQAQVQAAGGPSTAIQRQVENGTYSASMHQSLRRGYEQALGLPRGSIDILLAGESLPDDADSVGAGADGGRQDDAHDDGLGQWLTRTRSELTDAEQEQMWNDAQPVLEALLERTLAKRRRGSTLGDT